ncbi:MAG: hypothetical protein JWM96_38 [Alphaproteobacteria bacterium]|nr:hypothetical protein [Alphaproteobacteria bacterium]
MITFNPDKILPWTANLGDGHEIQPRLQYFQANGTALCYAAIWHEEKISSESHRLIAKAFAEFKPQAVITEGPVSIAEANKEADKEEFARNALSFGQDEMEEHYYACRLAVKNNIPYLSGEPSKQALQHYLIGQNYTAFDFFAYNFMLPLGYLQDEETDIEKLQRLWSAKRAQYDTIMVEKPPEDVTAFTQWFYKGTGMEFAFGHLGGNHSDVNQPFGSVNHVSGLFHHYRDRHCLGVAEQAVNAFDRVLVVYGAAHLWTLHPALEDGFAPSPAIKAKPGVT